MILTKHTYLLLALLLISRVALAQFPTSSTSLNGNRIVIVDDMEGLRDSRWVATPPAVLIKMPASGRVTSRELSSLYQENRSIPEKDYTLQFPRMGQQIDTLLLMMYLELPDLGPDQGIMHHVLITNFGSRYSKYYIDYNNNYDFADDGKPTTFFNLQKAKDITITIKGDNRYKRQYKYRLPNLALDEYLVGQFMDEQFRSERTLIDKSKLRLDHLPRLNFNVGIAGGAGHTSFAYKTPSSPDNAGRKFDATVHSTIQLVTSASYSIKNLTVGGILIYEDNHIGEQHHTVTFNSGQLFVTPNTGLWPQAKLEYGLFSEYDIPLSKTLYLTPQIQYLTYRYIKQNSFLGRKRFDNGILANPDMNYNQAFVNRHKVAFGLKVKYSLSGNSLIYFEARKVNTSFDLADGFLLEEYDKSSYTQQYETLLFGIGVQSVLKLKKVQ